MGRGANTRVVRLIFWASVPRGPPPGDGGRPAMRSLSGWSASQLKVSESSWKHVFAFSRVGPVSWENRPPEALASPLFGSQFDLDLSCASWIKRFVRECGPDQVLTPVGQGRSGASVGSLLLCPGTTPNDLSQGPCLRRGSKGSRSGCLVKWFFGRPPKPLGQKTTSGFL